MDERNNAGLLNAKPTSLDVYDVFTPPKPVNCGVLGNFKKLNTELPPSVCDCTGQEIIKTIIERSVRK